MQSGAAVSFQETLSIGSERQIAQQLSKFPPRSWTRDIPRFSGDFAWFRSFGAGTLLSNTLAIGGVPWTPDPSLGSECLSVCNRKSALQELKKT